MPILPFIQTPRLNLVLLTDTSEGSQDVQWFHEDWTDLDATAWFELLIEANVSSLIQIGHYVVQQSPSKKAENG